MEAVGTDRGEGSPTEGFKRSLVATCPWEPRDAVSKSVCLLGAQCPGCSSKPSVKPNRSEDFPLCSAPLPLSTFQIFLSALGRRMCCCLAKGMATGCKQDSYLKSRGSRESPLLHVSHQDHFCSSASKSQAPA